MFGFRPLIKEKYDCITSKLPNAFYYDFSNTSGAGFIYSLIRKAQKEGTQAKEMILLLDEVDKIKPKSELFMLLNLLEGNEIHKVVKKVEYHIKLKLRVFATCNDVSRDYQQHLLAGSKG